MSITPLDLQTMFVRLNDMSKEQSHSQHAASLQQEQEARKLAEQELRMDYSVNSSKEEQESGKVDEHGEGQSGGKHHHLRKGHGEAKEHADKEIVKDPAMGTHIDISG